MENVEVVSGSKLKSNCFRCLKNCNRAQTNSKNLPCKLKYCIHRCCFFYWWVPLPTCIDSVLNLCFQFVRFEKWKTQDSFKRLSFVPRSLLWKLISSICIRALMHTTHRLRKQSQLKTECHVRYKCNVYRRPTSFPEGGEIKYWERAWRTTLQELVPSMVDWSSTGPSRSTVSGDQR